MIESDIAKIREYIDDMMQRANDTSDKGAKGQWNTFNYIINSADTKAWAEGTAIGKDLVARLKYATDWYYDCIDQVGVFAQVLEQLCAKQENINNGNF